VPTLTDQPTVLILDPTGWRPAAPSEVVYCDLGHEATLTLTDDGPEVEGWAPDREDAPTRTEPGCVQWDCLHSRCPSHVSLNTRATA
jgi:hypothetical protein